MKNLMLHNITELLNTQGIIGFALIVFGIALMASSNNFSRAIKRSKDVKAGDGVSVFVCFLGVVFVIAGVICLITTMLKA